MSLENAVALVTGASGGLGARIAQDLAERGVNIAIGYRQGAERAAALGAAIAQLGRKSFPVELDQANPPSITTAVGQVVDHFGQLDILINNAGVASGGHTLPPGDLEAFTPEIWDEMMAVNLRGPYLVTRAAAKHLRKSAWGRVVNIGSTLGQGTWYADRAFAPSKAAVVPLTRFLAAALAPDVTVNCVAPGLMVETGLGGGGPQELVDGWRQRALLEVTTSVEDVARQVVALCDSPTITGQTMVVDGGIHFA